MYGLQHNFVRQSQPERPRFLVSLQLDFRRSPDQNQSLVSHGHFGSSRNPKLQTRPVLAFYASVNSACAHPPPPGWPPGISIFFALDGKFPGVGTLELSNPPGWGQKRGQMPRPTSTLQHFSLIARSNSAMLNILICDFLFQLTSNSN